VKHFAFWTYSYGKHYRSFNFKTLHDNSWTLSSTKLAWGASAIFSDGNGILVGGTIPEFNTAYNLNMAKPVICRFAHIDRTACSTETGCSGPGEYCEALQATYVISGWFTY